MSNTNIYDRLGVPTIINAKGTATRLSGGLMDPEVAEAMREATAYCVDIGTLQGRASELIADKTISGRIAKDVFDVMWETGKEASAIVEEKGLKQITDTGAIETIVDRLIADNPAQVQQFKDGNEKVLGWFVGQIMKATQGKANPAVANQLLRAKLSD